MYPVGRWWDVPVTNKKKTRQIYQSIQYRNDICKTDLSMGSLYSAHDALVGQPQPSSTAALMGQPQPSSTAALVGQPQSSSTAALVGQPQSQTLAAPNTATATGKKKKNPGTGKKKKKSAIGRHAIKNAMENDGEFTRAIKDGNRILANAV
jgi:hypothetical protein